MLARETVFLLMLIALAFHANSSSAQAYCDMCYQLCEGCKEPSCPNGGPGTGTDFEHQSPIGYQYNSFSITESGGLFLGESLLIPDSAREKMSVCDYGSLHSMIDRIGADSDQYFSTPLGIHGYEFNGENIAAIRGTIVLQQNHCELMKMQPIFNSHTLPVDGFEIPEEIATDIGRLRKDGLSEGILIDQIFR